MSASASSYLIVRPSPATNYASLMPSARTPVAATSGRMIAGRRWPQNHLRRKVRTPFEDRFPDPCRDARPSRHEPRHKKLRKLLHVATELEKRETNEESERFLQLPTSQKECPVRQISGAGPFLSSILTTKSSSSSSSSMSTASSRDIVQAAASLTFKSSGEPSRGPRPASALPNTANQQHFHADDKKEYSTIQLTQLAKEISRIPEWKQDIKAYFWEQLVRGTVLRKEPLDSAAVYVLFVTVTKLRNSGIVVEESISRPRPRPSARNKRTSSSSRFPRTTTSITSHSIPEYGAFIQHLCSSVERWLYPPSESGGRGRDSPGLNQITEDPATVTDFTTNVLAQQVLEDHLVPAGSSKTSLSNTTTTASTIPTTKSTTPSSLSGGDSPGLDQLSTIPSSLTASRSTSPSTSARTPISELKPTHLCGICGTFAKLAERIADPCTLASMRRITQGVTQLLLMQEEDRDENGPPSRSKREKIKVSGQDLGYLLDACRALDLYSPSLQQAVGNIVRANWDMAWSDYGLQLVTTSISPANANVSSRMSNYLFLPRSDRLAWRCLSYRLREAFPAFPGSGVVQVIKAFHRLRMRDMVLEKLAVELLVGGGTKNKKSLSSELSRTPAHNDRLEDLLLYEMTPHFAQLSAQDVFDVFLHTDLLKGAARYNEDLQLQGGNGYRYTHGMTSASQTQLANLLLKRIPDLRLHLDATRLLDAITNLPIADLDQRALKRASAVLLGYAFRSGKIASRDVATSLERLPASWLTTEWRDRVEVTRERNELAERSVMTQLEGGRSYDNPKLLLPRQPRKVSDENCAIPHMPTKNSVSIPGTTTTSENEDRRSTEVLSSLLNRTERLLDRGFRPSLRDVKCLTEAFFSIERDEEGRGEWNALRKNKLLDLLFRGDFVPEVMMSSTMAPRRSHDHLVESVYRRLCHSGISSLLVAATDANRFLMSLQQINFLCDLNVASPLSEESSRTHRMNDAFLSSFSLSFMQRLTNKPHSVLQVQKDISISSRASSIPTRDVDQSKKTSISSISDESVSAISNQVRRTLIALLGKRRVVSDVCLAHGGEQERDLSSSTTNFSFPKFSVAFLLDLNGRTDMNLLTHKRGGI
ncbi:unnamed protein product [Amoebophrya sp. A25]|nr:unnamed protein product [Amoebophrya sp. A25]|eukprot:GSA25T00022294001.1